VELLLLLLLSNIILQLHSFVGSITCFLKVYFNHIHVRLTSLSKYVF